MKEANYYAIIPANVRYDKDLSANAKLLYGEITALSNGEGYCWATNSYFANLYNVSNETISRWISQLIKKGYIKSVIIYKNGTKEIDLRKLYVGNIPIDENVNTPIDKNINTFGICQCAVCRGDLAALALNHLPPKYVSTEKGRLISATEKMSYNNILEIIKAIAECAEMVKQNPRHEKDLYE